MEEDIWLNQYQDQRGKDSGRYQKSYKSASTPQIRNKDFHSPIKRKDQIFHYAQKVYPKKGQKSSQDTDDILIWKNYC